MDENILDNLENIEESVEDAPQSVEDAPESIEDSGESDISDIGGNGDISGSNEIDSVSENDIAAAPDSDEADSIIDDTLEIRYDEELGGYPVVIVNDVSNEEVSILALPSGTSGYQVSDYWLDYFRGVLQKHFFDDYLIYATREYNGSSYNNYMVHNWLFVGDLENGGEVIVYDCYSENSIYHVDISTETMAAVNPVSYSTLAYSNLGNLADIREGGGYIGDAALLFFMGFFTVFFVCYSFFKHVRSKR